MLISTNTTHMFVLIIIRSFPRSLLICNSNKMTGANRGAGIGYISEIHSRFYLWVLFARSLVFYILFRRSLFVIFLLAIVLVFLRFAAFGYTFGIFKLVVLFNARPHNNTGVFHVTLEKSNVKDHLYTG